VDSCRRRPPDLMILDLIMPRKEGIETIRELKHEMPQVKIIAISGGGHGQPESYLSLAQRLGAEGTLAKPFLPMQLVQMVNEVLAQGAPEA
jgi:DNA-binding NarL/FixJ family response regulator